MKALFIFICLSLGFGYATTAHADSYTCNGVVVSADPGTKVLVGLDAEPPYQVMENETKEFYFFQKSDQPTVDHRYNLNVVDLATGAQIKFVSEVISGCPTISYNAPPVVQPMPTYSDTEVGEMISDGLTIEEPPVVQTTVPKQEDEVSLFVPSELFPGLELAYPW